MHMKYVFVVIFFLFLGGGAYWFFYMQDSDNSVPSNLPTAEEIERMNAVEDSSSQIAPNAVTGVGVRPKGSLPIAPPVETTATSSMASSTEATSTIEEAPVE